MTIAQDTSTTDKRKTARVLPSLPAEVRFWRQVNKTDGCWLWTGHPMKHGGYGAIGVIYGGKTRMIRAHRFSWEIHNGPIPTGLCVLHSCDTPLCVRPDHLFLGTQQENLEDMRRKGRGHKLPPLRGHEHPEAKLSFELACSVVAMVRGGTPYADIAKIMKCGIDTISRIATGKSYVQASAIFDASKCIPS